MVTPKLFAEEYIALGDGSDYIERYVKDDIMKSFFFNNAIIYNFGLENELTEKLEGNLEVYIVKNGFPEDDVRYSYFMSDCISHFYWNFNFCFYIKNARIEYNGIIQDYDEQIIEIEIPRYGRIHVDGSKAYAYLSHNLSNDGGIIIEGNKQQIKEFLNWNYHVVHNSNYNKSINCATVVRKQHTPENKARLVLEAIRGEKTINEISSQNNIHPDVLLKWKREAESQLFKLFQDNTAKARKAQKDTEAEINDLYTRIRKLTAENESLKKLISTMSVFEHSI